MKNRELPRTGSTRRGARWVVVVALLALLALLAACGSGSNDDATDDTTNDTLAEQESSKDADSKGDADETADDPVRAVTVSADLADPNGPFPTFDDSAGSGFYGNDVYTVVTKPTEAKTVSAYGRDDFGQTTSIVAGVDSTGAPADAGFGLVCRMQDGENYYRFGIGNDGTYSIAVVVDDEAALLTSDDGFWSESNLIDPAARTFELEARCFGDDLELYVNDQLVDSVTDDTYTSGSVGVFSETFTAPNASVAFTSFGASGAFDSGVLVPQDEFDAWRAFFLNTPTEITKCELTSAKRSGLEPVPDFVTSCAGIRYAQARDADAARDAFDALVEATGADLELINGFPDCRDDTDVSGELPTIPDTTVRGRVACIEQGDDIGIVWWNEAGIVAALQWPADDPDFVADWAADWWPFRAVPPAN